jgi:RNA polymerase primary sigma factor
MTDSVKDYLNLVARYPLLSAEQEIQLSRQVQAMRDIKGQADLTPQQQRIVKRGIKARNAIVNANLRLVVHIAKRYMRRLDGGHMELMDIIQEGNFGLHRAAELFDGARGYKFSTYAYWWIRQAITRAIDTQEHAIRMPQHSVDRFHRAVRLQEEYVREHGAAATPSQLAEMLEITPDELLVIMARGMRPKSLDQLATEDGSPLIDMIADERSDVAYEIAERIEGVEQLRLAFFRLKDEDRIAISKRYGIGGYDPQTLKEIGAQEGVSRERIRQRIDIAQRKLRLIMSQCATMDAA